MSAGDPDLQPDNDDVLQVEDPAGYEPEVNVKVCNPVRVQLLPRKAGATFTKTVAAMPTPTHLLRPNPRRASVTVISDAEILIALSRASAADASMMALWPAGVPFTSSAATDLLVAAETGTAVVSVIEELWATGEGA